MAKGESVNTDADRHQTVRTALNRILHHGEFPEGGFELLEIRSTAAGELTWRVRAPRAEEVEIGYLPPP